MAKSSSKVVRRLPRSIDPGLHGLLVEAMMAYRKTGRLVQRWRQRWDVAIDSTNSALERESRQEYVDAVELHRVARDNYLDIKHLYLNAIPKGRVNPRLQIVQELSTFVD